MRDDFNGRDWLTGTNVQIPMALLTLKKPIPQNPSLREDIRLTFGYTSTSSFLFLTLSPLNWLLP